MCVADLRFKAFRESTWTGLAERLSLGKHGQAERLPDGLGHLVARRVVGSDDQHIGPGVWSPP